MSKHYTGCNLWQTLKFLFCQKAEGFKWYNYLSLDFYIDWVFRTKPTSLMNVICRLKGHPNGYWYYSGGLEPDTHCKDCGEDLG